MGGWTTRIGKWEAGQMDYYYEKIKEEGMPLSYYQAASVTVDIRDLHTGKKKQIQVPLCEMHQTKLEDDGTYTLITECDTLFQWFWREIKKKGLLISSAFRINACAGCPDYFLNSDIFDENITITTIKRVFEINTMEELDWLNEHGFVYERI